ncbi:hypothetical protein MWH28_06720 [Natroniella sulfidigena]|uniref:hypothetical protein n=1 Tax=Natroniella sulfidigena TaxID=723921 RepID=UPI00200AE381|nr:hypothetical protein [Natroniella sulfidigena]MCK8817065.1 hypothetical protein [Natroniella sulfidigena]
MGFTFQAQSSSSDVSDSVSLELTVSPEKEAITKENMTPGDSVSATINVANTGTVDTFYFISVDWSAAESTTPAQATRLANELEITVTVPDPATLYSGKMVDLINQPPDGRLLTLEIIEEDVTFTITLPETAGTSLAGIGIIFDLIFIAT